MKPLPMLTSLLFTGIALKTRIESGCAMAVAVFILMSSQRTDSSCYPLKFASSWFFSVAIIT